jgi:hypothetical protein
MLVRLGLLDLIFMMEAQSNKDFLQCCLKGMTCLLGSLIVYFNSINSNIEIWLHHINMEKTPLEREGCICERI